MSLEIVEYRAFVEPRSQGGGNRAAVVFGMNIENERRMQELASSLGAPATVFVAPSETLFDDGAPMPTRLRFFTPQIEETVCGHGTIAALQALHDRGGLDHFPHGFPEIPFRVEFPLGLEYVRFEDGMPWLTYPDPTALALEDTDGERREAVALALGLEPEDLHEDLPVMAAGVGRPKLVCGVPSTVFLDAIEADGQRLAAVCRETNTTGLVAFTFPGRYGCFTDSRHFSLQHGVVEDSATGNAHVALAAYLTANRFFDEGDRAFAGAQGYAMGEPSRIEVRLSVRDGKTYGVRVGGRARKVEP